MVLSGVYNLIPLDDIFLLVVDEHYYDFTAISYYTYDCSSVSCAVCRLYFNRRILVSMFVDSIFR